MSMLGKTLSEEAREKIRQRMLGRKITWGNKISEAKKGHTWPEGYKERQSLAQKKRFEWDSPWNKGINSDKRTRRESKREYRKEMAWRVAVFKRDNYTCQKCEVRGGRLEADHIKMWMLYPLLRFDLNNGQTLCLKCHKDKTSAELRVYWTNQFQEQRHYHTLTDEQYKEIITLG